MEKLGYRSFRDKFAPPVGLGCFICGVDSAEIRNFLLMMIGSLVLGSVCIGVWSYTTGRLQPKAEMESLPLRAETNEEIK